ncbi:MAG: hypothetical protein CK424_05550 [Legionella sp.]|nr:MAG: hypothetical protein CK424_05550 [Legionella sp.]
MTPEQVLYEMNYRYARLFWYRPETSLFGLFSSYIDRSLRSSIAAPRTYLKKLMNDPCHKDKNLFANAPVFSKFIGSFDSVIKISRLPPVDPYYISEKDATRLVLGYLLRLQWRGPLDTEKYPTVALLHALMEAEQFTEDHIQNVLNADDPKQYVDDLIAAPTPRCSEDSESELSLTRS